MLARDPVGNIIQDVLSLLARSHWLAEVSGTFNQLIGDRHKLRVVHLRIARIIHNLKGRITLSASSTQYAGQGIDGLNSDVLRQVVERPLQLIDPGLDVLWVR